MKTKVLFLVSSLSRAGAETQLVDLINGLDPSRFDKALVIFDKNSDQLDRVDTTTIDFFQFVRTNRFDGRVVLKLAELIRTMKPDAIHCTNQFTMLIAWAAKNFARVKPKLLVTLHSTKTTSFRAEIYERTLYRWVMRQFDCVIFVCFTQAAYWNEKYKEIRPKSVVIHNGVDTEFYNPLIVRGAASSLRRKLSIPRDVPVIACVAAFRPEKEHALLIEAYSLLSGEPHLILAGDGELREQAEKQAHELGLQQKTHFLGNIEDVRSVLAIADVMVLPSAVEAFSIAMLESMAMGTPVVATDVGGLHEAIIPHKTGYLLPAGSVSELARSLSEAISDRKNLEQLGATARNLVLEKFSTAKMIEQTSAVLCRMLDRNCR